MWVFIVMLSAELVLIFLGSFGYYAGNAEMHKIRVDLWKKIRYKRIRFIYPPQAVKYETTIPLLLNYLFGILIFILTIVLFLTNLYSHFTDKIELMMLGCFLTQLLFVGGNTIIASVTTNKRVNLVLDNQLLKLINNDDSIKDIHDIKLHFLKNFDSMYTNDAIEKSIRRLMKNNDIVRKKFKVK